MTKDEFNKYGIYALELGQELGLETGDRILKVNGQDYAKFQDVISPDVMLGSESYYTVERDGETLEVAIPADFIETYSEEGKEKGFIQMLEPYDVGKVARGSAAAKAGLEEGDKILEVNGENVVYFQFLRDMLMENKGKQVSLLVDRDGASQTLICPGGR